MTVQINANQFSLKYIPDEDRMLFCVTISAEHEIGTLLTRRLTRWLIDALMKQAPPSAATVTKEDITTPAANEPSPAAGENKPAGESREEKPRALAVPPRLVREVKVAPRESGDVALVFLTGEQQIVLDIAAARIVPVAEIFLDLAGKAGWDFAGVAAKPVKPAPAEAEPHGKVLH
jgi:hypothetical protein